MLYYIWYIIIFFSIHISVTFNKYVFPFLYYYLHVTLLLLAYLGVWWRFYVFMFADMHVNFFGSANYLFLFYMLLQHYYVERSKDVAC